MTQVVSEAVAKLRVSVDFDEVEDVLYDLSKSEMKEAVDVVLTELRGFPTSDELMNLDEHQLRRTLKREIIKARNEKAHNGVVKPEHLTEQAQQVLDSIIEDFLGTLKDHLYRAFSPKELQRVALKCGMLYSLDAGSSELSDAVGELVQKKAF